MRRPRVASIAPGLPFLPALVEAVLDGSLGIGLSGPVAADLSAATIFVPTRRAARALAAAFADALQPSAVLLPRIVPLGDPSDLEERLLLSEMVEPGRGETALPPAIGDFDRRFRLTRLVDAWRGRLETDGGGRGLFTVAASPADAFALAGDLAGLIDEFWIEGVDWRRVGQDVPGEFDRYWSLTAGFLRIAAEYWPAQLQELGLLDAVRRRDLLLRAEARRLELTAPDVPFIVAGSTGTVPATAQLMAAIARLPSGAVVLPGLDLHVDEATWAAIGEDGGETTSPGHPQSALKRLLARLEIERADVVPLGRESPSAAARTRIVSAALRPAGMTDGWPRLREELGSDIAEAIAGVTVVEADDERLEALAVALILRETLEHPGRTAALVTPDRVLAMRVGIELQRWGMTVEDSGGRPLASTPMGALAALALAARRADFAVVETIALLRHPLVKLGMTKPDVERAATAFEIGAARGAFVAPGLDGLRLALDDAPARRAGRHAPPPLQRLSDEAFGLAATLLDRLDAALSAIPSTGCRPLAAFATAHAACLEALTASADDSDLGLAASAVQVLLDDLAAAEDAGIALSLTDYESILSQLMIETAAPEVRDPDDGSAGGRVKIWGLLEARLLHADRLVLGGLNEETWPPVARTDALLNRSMRKAIGLTAPERRIGQSTHDFAQAMGAPDVVLTRARSIEGRPTVASRLLRRLDAFIGTAAAAKVRQRGAVWLELARQIDEPEASRPAARPVPKPAVERRPVRLSFSDVSVLYRDPYALFARDVLNLRKLPPLETALGAGDRGNLIHDALSAFSEATRRHWPADPLPVLMAHGEVVFAPLMDRREVAAFWWPRFARMAEWFVAWAADRRTGLSDVLSEVTGRQALTLADGSVFILGGRADRIERRTDGTLAIIDFKTGRVPGEKEVLASLQPQLTLEGAVAMAGGFAGVPPQPVSELLYVKLGTAAGGKETSIKVPDESVATLAERHLLKLTETLDAYRRPDVGYLSRRRPRRKADEGDYDHLARVREWAGIVLQDGEP